MGPAKAIGGSGASISAPASASANGRGAASAAPASSADAGAAEAAPLPFALADAGALMDAPLPPIALAGPIARRADPRAPGARDDHVPGRPVHGATAGLRRLARPVK